MNHGQLMLGSKPSMIYCWMKSNFRWCASMTHVHIISYYSSDCLVSGAQTRLGYALVLLAIGQYLHCAIDIS